MGIDTDVVPVATLEWAWPKTFSANPAVDITETENAYKIAARAAWNRARRKRSRRKRRRTVTSPNVATAHSSDISICRKASISTRSRLRSRTEFSRWHFRRLRKRRSPRKRSTSRRRSLEIQHGPDARSDLGQHIENTASSHPIKIGPRQVHDCQRWCASNCWSVAQRTWATTS